MAASDPTTDVPTPTGTLQGVAAFSWDGTAWQPAGRAGPSVATPTGVLRGVAAFNGGPSWQPAGQAQPGVATPTGTLDGVAVYTWSGAAWTPPGGTATPSTPHGALRGVAAFNWDGAAWQPAAQAGPSVATPYGVLDGVAMFNWSGSAWAAVGAPSLSLDFMTPGTLDPRITFTRASTAAYIDASGFIQMAATNAPRWDYAGGVLRGLLIEEQRTNVCLQSAGVAVGGAWALFGSIAAAPTVTANNAIAPDGTTTATRMVIPAVSGGGSSVTYQPFTATAAPYTYSVWLRGNAGGEQVYVGAGGPGLYYSIPRITLTTQWQRFMFTTPALTAAGWTISIGTDLRDGTQTSTPAQTIYAWGAQVEQGAFATSYIPTTAAAVTRAADVCTMPTAAWFNAAAGTLQTEFLVGQLAAAGTQEGVLRLDDTTDNNRAYVYVSPGAPSLFGAIGGAVQINTGAVSTLGIPVKAAISYGGATWGGAIGGTLYPGSAGLVPFPATRIVFGSGTPAATTWQLDGYIRRVSYWPRVLSNTEMQQVTT